MATWKAEFLSHYYEGRRRPLRAYAFGKIDRWARLASRAPGAANFFANMPGVGHLMRAILGVAPERQLPRFAAATFRQWAEKSGVPLVGGRIPATSGAEKREVILWVDTFNNHFHPETAQAALEVLTDAGFKVMIPGDPMCCGRPLYDFGMTLLARKYLLRIRESLKNAIEAGTPVVVLEPGCASVFRDEMCNFFPQDAKAQRLRSQTFLLSEFLEGYAPEYQPPRLEQKVLLHGHCHQKALMKMSHAESLLRKMGAEVQSPDAGCCGMAGPFGFEKEKYAISQAIGERVLLPAVRQAPPETLIVSDGFSCREQIVQATGRKVVHLAEAMRMGIRKRTGDKA
jgi:Fe-S oxidoreductase